MPKKEFASRAATAMTEEEMRFGAARASVPPQKQKISHEVQPSALAPTQARPGKVHRIALILDESLYRRSKKCIASGETPYPSVSAMLRSLMDDYLRRSGY